LISGTTAKLECFRSIASALSMKIQRLRAQLFLADG
jgi:hypothetical protein